MIKFAFHFSSIQYFLIIFEFALTIDCEFALTINFKFIIIVNCEIVFENDFVFFSIFENSLLFSILFYLFILINNLIESFFLIKISSSIIEKNVISFNFSFLICNKFV